MCGCSNNQNSCQPCTIILIIVILANQGLLDGSPKSKNALTLLFLYWLCGANRGNGSNCSTQMVMPTNCGCKPSCICKPSCECECKCKKSCCKCKEKKCKCKRIKVCCNNTCCNN
ncbi:MAG: hypothetical protein RR891_04320 [Clostridium sp.]|uniref:hypothetical protein n=1 Tax=Clostridium sp. TaxID=1506 RepID=UPI00306B572F